MEVDVAFDESGNTGQDLLNASQPAFVLASVDASDEEARDLLRVRSGEEAHFSALKKSGRGRAEVLRVLESHALVNSDRAKVAFFHKPFMVDCKIIDVMLEPVARSYGLDAYAGGEARAMATVLHWGAPQWAPAEFDEFRRGFVRMLHRRRPEDVEKAFEALRRLATAAPQMAPLPEFLLDSRPHVEDELERLRAGTVPDELEPALPALVSLVHAWTEVLDSVRIIHDDAKAVRRWQSMLEQFFDPDKQELRLQMWDGGSLRYPLPVSSIELVDSRRRPAVQLADLIAGAVNAVCVPLARGGQPTGFAKELQDLAILDLRTPQCVWPSTSVDEAPAHPDATPFYADAIADWLGS